MSQEAAVGIPERGDLVMTAPGAGTLTCAGCPRDANLIVPPGQRLLDLGPAMGWMCAEGKWWCRECGARFAQSPDKW